MSPSLFALLPLDPPGFVYVADFLSPDDERALLTRIASLSFAEIRMRGAVARRSAAHFGWDYAYAGGAIARTSQPPDFLLALRERAIRRAGFDPDAFEEVLVHRYPPGASIGWHRDAPMFGPVVVGVSLGAACTMRFRPRGATTRRDAISVPLAPRSLYVLSGDSRARWQHQIPPVRAMRYSVTFRTVVR